MSTLHPSQAKAELRQLLTTDLVLTTAQLERWGLLRAATWLELPTVTMTCRTRVTQSESDTDLTFVALEAEHLDQAPRELMHLCGLAEARRGRVLAAGEEWRHVRLAGRSKGHQPDAEVVQLLDGTRRSDCAVEFDAGYSTKRISQKLEAATNAGYSRILWATSIHRRAETVMDQATRLHRQGRLVDLRLVETQFVDFWSPHDPYTNRPRCYKPMRLTQAFSAAAK